MHETSARAWCTGKTQRDQVEREVGGRIGMGNTCNSMADSCQCMSKTTQYCKVISLQLIKINEKNKCKRKCKVLQTEKVIYHMISLMGNLKRNDTNELMYKTERDSQT